MKTNSKSLIKYLSVDVIKAHLFFHKTLDEDKLLEGAQPLIPVAFDLLLHLFGFPKRRQH